jgi:type IV secretion system protein VirB6
VLLLFESTQRYFEAWVAQLANYALVGVLAVLTASLMLTVVEAYATQTAAKGAAILTVDALDMLLVAGLVLLLLRQVMPIAARLGGGVTLTSFGVASGVLGRGASAGSVVGQRVGGGMAAQMSERLGSGIAAWRAATAVQTLTPAGVSGATGIGRVMPSWRNPGSGRGG